MTRVIWSPKAIAQLNDILDFITDQNGLGRSDRVAAKIVSTLIKLSSTPGTGRLANTYSDQRRLSIRPWIVFYTVLRDNDGIRVDAILDGRRNLPALR